MYLINSYLCSFHAYNKEGWLLTQKTFCNLQDTKLIPNCQEQHHHKQFYLITHNKVLKKISIIILGDVKHPLMNFAGFSAWFNALFKGEENYLTCDVAHHEIWSYNLSWKGPHYYW